MGTENNYQRMDYTDRLNILDNVIHFIFITGEKGKYNVSIDPEDCSIRICVPGYFLIQDNIKTIGDRVELYKNFDALFFNQLEKFLNKNAYRKMIKKG